MTFIISINTEETIFLLADRRLSGGCTRDDARQIMFLETSDGVAILGYAGLGMTAQGMEPSDWMSAVLRGRSGLTIEGSLAVLADAVQSQLPRQLLRFPSGATPAHNIIVPAFVGTDVRIYSIDIALASDRKQYHFRFTRHVTQKPYGRSPKFAAGGSGGVFLNRQKKWKRHLMRVVKAYEKGKLSEYSVADYLARLNVDVAAKIPDGSVGPQSIVAWRHRKDGVHNGGGAHQFYNGTTRASETPTLPTIGNGMDVAALLKVIAGPMMKAISVLKPGSVQPRTEIDKDALNAELALLPDKPDEHLK